jgi:rfaE bifunctional protein kinase chain/domain
MRRSASPPSAERLLSLIDSFKGRRILVIADFVADEFLYGRVQRVSREAPVLILEYDSTDVRLGGGANAVHNIHTLGGKPAPVGVLGKDDHGRRLRGILREAGIPASQVFDDASYLTPVKTRILAGGVHTTKQQMVRIDNTSRLSPTSPIHRQVLRALKEVKGRVDGVLVSDYGFGLVTEQVVDASCAFARKRRIPVTVDSRYALLSFRGMTAVTPNEPEVEAALRTTIGNNTKRLESAGRSLLRRIGASAALITRGSEGMALFEPRRPALHIPIYGSDQVADVTGAGDTVIATFTLSLAAGATPAEASFLANYAGGIVVMKRGTATVSHGELTRAVTMDRALD